MALVDYLTEKDKKSDLSSVPEKMDVDFVIALLNPLLKNHFNLLKEYDSTAFEGLGVTFDNKVRSHQL